MSEARNTTDILFLKSSRPPHEYTSSGVAASTSRRRTSVPGVTLAPSPTGRTIAAVLPLAE